MTLRNRRLLGGTSIGIPAGPVVIKIKKTESAKLMAVNEGFYVTVDELQERPEAEEAPLYEVER